jgi:hypothetical protein
LTKEQIKNIIFAIRQERGEGATVIGHGLRVGRTFHAAIAILYRAAE